ncbi:hypothetical protein ACFLTB_00870 [Chloroflexota bacterium]
MTDSQKRILEMLAEKKITIEEAERLLSLTGSTEEEGDKSPDKAPAIKLPYKYLRVVVQPGPENDSGNKTEKVNIRVPMKLIRAGMKLTALIPPHAADKMHDAMSEKGIDFDLRNMKPDDIEEFIEALSDLEVDVKDGKETVRVYVE